MPSEPAPTLPKELFEAAVSLLIASPQEQQAGLLDLCRRHPAHAEALRTWLAANRREPPAEHGLKPGDRIGPYSVLQVLGEGGMGTVYLAEQKEPVRRRVAIKLIKLGMDSAQVLRRFELERQALAVMSHDSIARVFDCGTSERGQPYFVMEYVKGTPITDYCERMRLSLEERLRLFQQVCSAVQHAHQKGVVHRDLKPSNVLVTDESGKPVPKIIDFGLARATDHMGLQQSLFTEIGNVLGTPEYMSPEQADASVADIDTRTDIYSLGVMLYEVLTGGLPFPVEELRQAGFVEMRRVIREVEPPRPSTRLLQRKDAVAIATARKTSSATLHRALKSDLDWVVLKAMEKDRTRRYESAAGLAADLQRFLDH
jgi:non-specific serine/threonine protein kinase/serine/threonine-protein kinase